MSLPAVQRPKVAIIGTRGYPSYYGGFETAVRRLAPALVDLGWQVRVYGRKSAIRLDDPAIDKRVTSTVTFGIDSTALSTLSFGFTSTVHALIRKPQVALVMNVANGFWLPLLRLRGIRTVVNVDGIEWERDKWSRIGKAVFKAGAWLTAKFADTLVFDAEAIGDYWRREFGRDGVFIPYGADQFPPLELTDDFEPGAYVLLVARFVPENTLVEFIAAAKLVARTHDVVLVGSAPPEDPIRIAVEQAAATHSRFHWLGHVSDDTRLFALWQNAGAYFHGHSVGGTNPALVQAMALGSKIVARDTVYNREVLADAGVFVGVKPEEISEALLEMLDSAEDWSARARARADQFYNWDLVVRRYGETVASERAN